MWRSVAVDASLAALEGGSIANLAEDAEVEGGTDRRERVLALIRRLPLEFEGEDG